jgi:osmotically-inducible protein OsmY
MRALRAVLLIVLLILIGVFAFGWWTGSGIRDRGSHPTGTTGSIDASKARERGAEAGEKAAEAAGKIRDSVEEAALSSKIKAKMALDDSVRARSIDVSTNGSTVTLSGTVRSDAERDRAIRLARETAGITTVVNHLEVQR